MIRISVYLKPHRLEAVKTAIASLGVSGMTVSDVRGTGNSPERSDLMGGDPHLVALPLRAKLEVVCADSMQEDVIATVLEHAQTGEMGDGKIFVQPVTDAVRIRTGERGDAAI